MAIKYDKFIGGLRETDSGHDIKNSLASLPLYDKLQSDQILYSNTTVKNVLDSLTNAASGNLLLRAFDGTQRATVDYRINFQNSIVRSGSVSKSDVMIALDPSTYSMQILPGDYTVLSIEILSDNDMSNNVKTVGITTIDNIDVGSTLSVVNIVLKPSALPLLNSISINGGSVESSSSDLNISLDTVGVISHYMISQNSDFNGSVWTEYNGNFVYTFNYISEINLTLYVKVKNSLGESDVKSSSIFLKNGIARSDSNKTYNNLDTCVSDIVAEYGSDLTQDVTILVTSPVNMTTKGRAYNKIFYMTLEDFNLNSPYVLTIDGSSNLNMNCNSLGGFKFNNCDNIIVKGVNFTNVANNMNDVAPEQTCAVFVQGTNEDRLKNIVVDNCIIDGAISWTDGATYYGYYGLIFKYIDCVSVVNTEIKGINAYGLDILGVKAVSLSNVHVHQCVVSHNIVSQPCFVNVKSTDMLYIEDSLFDMSNFDTGVIGNNLIRIICNRSSFINSRGEVFRFGNTIDMELLEMTSCVVSNNITLPYYSWIKQCMLFSTINNVVLYNNTIRLTAVSGNQFYATLLKGSTLRKLYMYNNIFDFYFPNLAGNRAEGAILDLATLESMESNYNVYRDYTTNYDTITNLFLTVSSPTSPIYMTRCQKMSDLRSKGLDLNSTIINVLDSLFVDDDFSNLSAPVSSLSVSNNHVPRYDINKTVTDTPNVGAYNQTYTTPVADEVYEYRGLDTFRLTQFDSSSVYDTYSNNMLLLIGQGKEKSAFFDWKLTDESSTVYRRLGLSIGTSLLSKIDPSGTYAGDMSYDIEIIKIV